MTVRLLCSAAAWGDYRTAIAPPDGLVPIRFDRNEGGGFEVAWCSFDLWADRAVLDRFFGLAIEEPGLQWLHTSSAGLDRPDYRRLYDRGVTVTNAHISGGPIADVVLRSVLDVLQGAEAWRRAQHDHRWAPHGFREVAGTTWLIVGTGAIGTAVAARASAFGATTVGVRRTVRGDEPFDRMVTPGQLASELGGADVVVMCLPATAANDAMVDAGFLASMKADSVLVNVARGSLIDDDALFAALDRGRPAAAILDVHRTEPLPADSPWWDHPRVTVLPHTTALGDGVTRRANEVFADNVARWSRGEELRGVAGRSDFAAD